MKRLPSPTQQNSLDINGQLWHIRLTVHVMGESHIPAFLATRYSDGATETAKSFDALIGKAMNAKEPTPGPGWKWTA